MNQDKQTSKDKKQMEKRDGFGFFTYLITALVPFIMIVSILFALYISYLPKEPPKSDEIQANGTGADPVPVEGSYSDASEEMRGVYIATVYNINYPSSGYLGSYELKNELDEIIDSCEKYRLNTIFFQASPCQDAMYDSDILPYSSFLTGREGAAPPASFDPLKYLVEESQKKGLKVYAWVNPVRVATGERMFSSLSDSNPAVQNPDWVVEYNGQYYFDLGIPSVRALEASVVGEIAERYDVDGIVFDDYFYPYPASGSEFADQTSYTAYGSSFSDIGDFRRYNSTQLVKECYKAVKAKRKDCEFGIAPFGIWKNNDGKNGGSNTAGSQSYNMIYCDTVEMINEGCLDFVAPQIYWEEDNTKFSYDVLAEWWNAAIGNSKTKLYISHAAYMSAEWDRADEISNQILFARDKKNYRGSIFYGYESIMENECNLQDQLKNIFEFKRIYSSYYKDSSELSYESSLCDDGYIIKGHIDPSKSLTYGFDRVSINKNGSFEFKAESFDPGLFKVE